MITLFDLGAEFWKNYFGSKSALDAYSLTYDRILYYRSDRLVVCADSPRSIRKEKHPTYKEKRGPKPEDALDALRSIQERCVALGIPLAQVDGWEGDDVVATLCSQAWPEEVQIIGSEKDFFCLIDDERVTLIGKNGPLTSAHCMEKFGVAPSQMTDWLAMVGDQADDIKGCPHCGPGRAAKLLERFGSLGAVKMGVMPGPGGLKPGDVPGVGQKTLEALQTWDPTQAIELVRMNDKLPLNLQALLAGR